MDHRQFLDNLSSTERKELQRKRNAPALIRSLVHIGLVIVIGFLIYHRLPGWPLLLFVQGILLVFLFNLQHECTHKTPFKTGVLNEIVGYTLAAVLVQPFLWFRYFHLDHHRYTNDPGKDPELIGHGKPENWPAYWFFISTLGYWKSKITLLFAQSFQPINDSYVPASAHKAIKYEARILLTLYLSLLLFSVFVNAFLLWVWLIPLCLGFPFLKLYHLAEHGLCPLSDDKFENTRTVMTNRVALFVTWNMPFHAEHHLLPSVPFHQLPKLNRKVHDHLGQVSQGYTGFTQQYLKQVASKTE